MLIYKTVIVCVYDCHRVSFNFSGNWYDEGKNKMNIFPQRIQHKHSDNEQLIERIDICPFHNVLTIYLLLIFLKIQEFPLIIR